MEFRGGVGGGPGSSVRSRESSRVVCCLRDWGGARCATGYSELGDELDQGIGIDAWKEGWVPFGIYAFRNAGVLGMCVRGAEVSIREFGLGS